MFGLNVMVPLVGEPVLVIAFEVLALGVWVALFDTEVVPLVRISVILVERLIV